VCFAHNPKRFNTFFLLSLCQVSLDNNIYIAFNIQKPSSVLHLFDDWVVMGKSCCQQVLQP
jgi:hypothetical protein